MHKSHQTDLLWIRKEISFLQFPRLSLIPPLMHGIFTRHGGVSSPPFDKLNLSYAVGDRLEDVTTNIRKIKKVIGAEEIIYMNQAHGAEIHVLHQGEPLNNGQVPAADAMITNIPMVGLVVKQADCQGVIIYDPERGVAANVHCGWRGNVQNILGSVVVRMNKEFGCKDSALLAAIGPSLGPCCAEFVNYKDIFPEEFKRFMIRENYFDLRSTSCWQLEEAGLLAKNIEVSGICTRCRTDLFYSFRGEGNTGRFGTVIMLR